MHRSSPLFTFTTSATPGLVNITGAMSGARFGAAAALPFVAGATVILVAFLLLLGFGATAGLGWIEALAMPLTSIGSFYLVWLAWKIARSDTNAPHEAAKSRPGFLDRIVVQGVNPKPWFVADSALITFGLPLDARTPGLVAFAAIYLVVCGPSLAAWAWVGAGWLANGARGLTALWRRCWLSWLSGYCLRALWADPRVAKFPTTISH